MKTNETTLNIEALLIQSNTPYDYMKAHVKLMEELVENNVSPSGKIKNNKWVCNNLGYLFCTDCYKHMGYKKGDCLTSLEKDDVCDSCMEFAFPVQG